ncbi:alkyl hydroperoxide reductase/ Thiol specific antioxidant/ Mal allergen [Oscillochloris trichoides DG-6]|uniref:Alkyl hydroperoxide reductase/ Thiol specific antioxidant/ Mal allergen n=1 Tax=Oscillochloris trichoides DG-6 TaxID=765420 RepID=E1IEP4_9CHLR|nr:TlpA disulfide reductase family protein [Oscillochloris trichoides]EFO80336.1 alkyl hydroperoxide reductase/ Thiol specific antioxidant/ Mal allergen [Oscillochloris trichoides DG-6]
MILWLLESQRRWRIFATLVLLLSAGWMWLARVPDAANGARIPSPRVDFPAPDFSLPTLDGDSIRLSDMRGQVVLLNVWATWCGPCRAEMPAIQRLYSESQPGLVILALNSTVQDDAAAVRGFADELGLSFPILLDTTGAVTHTYRVQALPTTFVLDRQGVIRKIFYGGPLNEATLRAALDPLLQEAP